MPTEDDLTIWSSMLDGKYMVKVKKIEPYRGGLTIAEATRCFIAKTSSWASTLYSVQMRPMWLRGRNRP